MESSSLVYNTFRDYCSNSNYSTAYASRVLVLTSVETSVPQCRPRWCTDSAVLQPMESSRIHPIRADPVVRLGISQVPASLAAAPTGLPPTSTWSTKHEGEGGFGHKNLQLGHMYYQ